MADVGSLLGDLSAVLVHVSLHAVYRATRETCEAAMVGIQVVLRWNGGHRY